MMNIKIRSIISSAAHELEAALVFAKYVVSAVGAVVVFVEAGVHEEGHAAAHGVDEAEEEGAPHEGRVAALLVHNRRHRHLAARTLDLDRVAKVLRHK